MISLCPSFVCPLLPEQCCGVCSIEYGTLRDDFAWWGASLNTTCLNECKYAKMDIFDERGCFWTKSKLGHVQRLTWTLWYGLRLTWTLWYWLQPIMTTPLWTKCANTLLVSPLRVPQRTSFFLSKC